MAQLNYSLDAIEILKTHFENTTAWKTQLNTYLTETNQTIDDLNIDSVLSLGNEEIVRSSETCKPFKFIFFTIFVGLMCVLGILGNTISMYVLQKDKKTGSTAHAATYLLQALAVADNAVLLISFIVLAIMYGFFPFIDAHDIIQKLAPYIFKYVSPLAHMAQTATVWMTVMLAVNRYIAICRPFDTYKRSSKKVARIQVIVVYIFAVLFNFPRFFQYEFYYESKKGDNSTNISESVQGFGETSIGPKSLFGKIYTNGLYTAIVLLLPILILIVLNSKLIIELRKMSRRNTLPRGKQGEGNLTIIMIIVIVIFIVCNLPDRINEIGKVIHQTRKSCSALYIIDCVCTALIIINSSSNFLVYYIFRKRFRQILLQKLCFRRGKTGDNEFEMMKSNGHHNDVLLNCNGLTVSHTLATSATVL